MKVYFKVGEHYFDTETGNEVKPNEALKGTVVVFREEKTYMERRNKARYRYAYKARDGTWILSNELSTPFLRRILEDRFGDKQIALLSPALVLTFFGNRQGYLVSSDADERQKFLETFFQGTPYREVDLKSALALVINNRKKFLILTALGSLMFPLLLLLLTETGEENNLPQLKKFSLSRKAETKRVKPLSPKDISISLTEGKIERLVEVLESLKPWQYVAKVDFSVGKVVVKSVKPDLGFIKEGNWFKKEVSILKRSDRKPFKSFESCLKELQFLGGEITKNLHAKVELRIRGSSDWDKVAKILNAVYGCPADLRGSAGTKRLPNKVCFSFSVNLFREVKR